MKIALVHPTYWPEVRRGSERLVHDLAVALTRRGHGVTILTSHPGPAGVAVEDGVEVRRSRRPRPLPGLHLYEDHLASAPAAALALARGGFDFAHALFPASGWAAMLARRHGGPPYGLSIHGILNREHLVSRRRRLEMLRDAAAGAGFTSALSTAAAEPIRRYALAEPIVLPGGVELDRFPAGARRFDEPTVLCPASLEDPRKGGAVLLEAFALLRARLPDARLLLAGGRDPHSSGAVPQTLPEGIEIRPASDTASLAELYGSAWATVLPAIDEAFGLVLVESLAAGTPAVAARSGAPPELLDAETGRLFEPGDPASLAGALASALELARDPDTGTVCRERARGWDWSRVVARYEAAYAAVLAAA